jgi:hypothetical protein
VTLSANVPSLTNATAVQFTFSSNKAWSTFNCSLDGAGTPGCGSPLSYSSLANGSHTFSVTATDGLGGTSQPATFSWTIDTTPPVTSITSTSQPNNGQEIAFTLASSKPNSTFKCSLDGASPTACPANPSYSNLSGGSHSFVAHAVDALGNEDQNGQGEQFSVQIPLTTTIVSTSPNTSPTNQTTATFSFTSNISGATFQCSLDGAAATPCTSPINYSGLVSATHTFFVQAVLNGAPDVVGASYQWTVNTIPPTITALSTSVTNSSFTINWTTSGLATSALNWGQGTSTANSVPDDGVMATTHSITVTGLSANTIYSYRISGHDPLGNVYQSARNGVRTSP